MVCGVNMSKQFRLNTYQQKKLAKHGLINDWKVERKAITSNRSIPPADKPGLITGVLDRLVAKAEAIEAGTLAPNPEAPGYAQTVEAQGFETIEGAPVTIEDCLWAFQNMAVKNVNMNTAPSQGAVALRDRAKVDTNIYKWLLEKISPKSFVDNEDKTDTRALDLVDLENQISSKWAKLLKKAQKV